MCYNEKASKSVWQTKLGGLLIRSSDKKMHIVVTFLKILGLAPVVG